VKRFHASPIEAIRYALVFFLLQAVFAYLGTALADWVGRRPSAILAALIEVVATILAATSDSLAEYQVFGAVAIATLGWLWGVGDTYIAEFFSDSVARHRLRDRSRRWPHCLHRSSQP
jgi:MFS transporter, putative metabolite:H+ symporter